jgi:magnesium-transporting ATPase (P-type)
MWKILLVLNALFAIFDFVVICHGKGCVTTFLGLIFNILASFCIFLVLSSERREKLDKEFYEKKQEELNNPYKCSSCGHQLAYVDAPCVNPVCSNCFKGL